MVFGINYKYQKIGICLTNIIYGLKNGFKISEDNELSSVIAEQKIDYAISKHYQDTPFKKIVYFCTYVDESELDSSTKIFIGKIRKKYENIKLEAFIYYKLVKAADELDSDTFVAFHEILLLDAIIAASKKYKIPEENYHELVERRSKLGTIPEWIPEMEDNPQLVIDMYKKSVPK
jgi:hypothetical protein